MEFSAYQPQFNLLSQDRIDAIHQASLDILWDCGIRVEQKEAADVFERAGAQVQTEGNLFRVRLPRELVEASIESTPESFTMHARNPEKNHWVGPGSTTFTAGFGEHVKMIDPKTRTVRATTKQDLINIAKIQDARDVFKFVNRAACSGDKPSRYQSVHNFHALLQGTSKHCILAYNGGRCAKIIVDMAEIVAGGADALMEKPPLTCFVSPTSPLTLVSEATEAMLEAIPRGLGIGITPMILSGASGPATPLGTAIQHNCELLMTITLAQCIRKGAYCIMANCSTMMDLKKAIAPVGVVEKAMSSLTTVAMGQHYNIPTWAGSGVTDAKLADAQMGCDYSLTTLPSVLAGANILYGLGAIDSLISFDYAACMIGVEQAERFMMLKEGVCFDDFDQTVDLIKEVAGPEGSRDYLSHRHTFNHMRAMSSAVIFDRNNRDKWESLGSKDAAERAYQEALDIIENHQVDPLDPQVDQALTQLLDKL
ncbi:MAG: trimethylamine methyltransferase family protein [Desulfobacterales bacterium]|nr:trimethylamine methyltransferase family protein [Desulfobacterales bacterium]